MGPVYILFPYNYIVSHFDVYFCVWRKNKQQKTLREKQASAAAISFEIICFHLFTARCFCLYFAVVVVVCFDIWSLSLKAWLFPLVASI